MSTIAGNAKKRNSEIRDNENAVVDSPRSKRNCALPTAVLKRNEVSNSCCPLFEHAVNKDCRVHMLSYLSVDDLSSFACVSKTFQDDCTHSTLPQSRTCEIICRSANILTVFDHIRCNGWDQTFQHKKSSLKVSCHNNLKMTKMSDIMNYNDKPLLTGVTSLDLSFSKSNAKSKRKLRNTIAKALSMIFPNLKELNLNNVEMSVTSLEAFTKKCPQLEVLHLARSNSFSLTDFDWMAGLKEVYLDNAILFFPRLYHYRILEDMNSNCCILGTVVETLKRLSLLGTTCTHYNPWFATEEPVSIPQSGLIKVVRQARNLKWFRSDLSKENIAMLQHERPDISFVS